MKRLIFNKAMTGRRLRPGALLIIYINIVRVVNRLWGKTSMGRNIYGAKCPSMGEVSMGRNVHGAKSPRHGGARVKCELRVAKLGVGILQVEVRAKRASI